jgi:hypothetical protein
LRNLVGSVLDNNNECSDFSEDEIESEVSCMGSDESSDEDSEGKNDDAPRPSKRVRTMTQKKRSDWKWTETDNNPPHTLHVD